MAHRPARGTKAHGRATIMADFVRGASWRSAAIAALLALAACTTPAPPVPVAAPPTTAPQIAAPLAPTPPPAPQPPVAAAANTPQFIGLSASQLQQHLGPAGFVRRDGAAEIWRYSVDDCHVDLFLYRDESGPRVQHVEARPRNGSRINARVCYERLWARRGAAVAG